jgi:DNA-binding HxlR family transcriptional regulator
VPGDPAAGTTSRTTLAIGAGPGDLVANRHQNSYRPVATRGYTARHQTSTNRPRGVEVLELDTAHRRVRLSRRLHQLLLAVPCLETLAANGPLRHGELGYALTAAGGKPVHSKTLSNALKYLTDNDLVVRHRGSRPHIVVYKITDFGRTVLHFFEAADQALQQHHHDANRRSTPRDDETPPGRQVEHDAR